MKKWYKVTFYAKMNEADIKAMNSSFYPTMKESMEISSCEGLQIEEDDTTEVDTSGKIYLENDSYELNEKTGELKIDKQIFDDFEVDTVITICFVDEDNIINDYIMKREDDEYIYCDYFGEAD